MLQAVALRSGADNDRAEKLAAHLGVPLMHAEDVRPQDSRTGAQSDSCVLVVDIQGLSLVFGELALVADFSAMLPRLRPRNLARELLVRAARGKSLPEHPIAIDATAGLGDDALLLAAAGFTVTMFERNPLVAALLDDALRRGSDHRVLAPIVGRMKLIEANAIDGLLQMPQRDERPDVVYLDPMFPEHKKAALTNKRLQILRQFEHPCTEDDAYSLLQSAKASGAHKVIVKRPFKGLCLASSTPSYTLSGKVVRYDCYVYGAAT